MTETREKKANKYVEVTNTMQGPNKLGDDGKTTCGS